MVNFNDVNYLPWLIPLGPLLAFAIIALLTNRSRLVPTTSHEYGGHHPDYDGMLVPVVAPWSRVLSIVVGMSGVTAAWLMSLVVFFQGISTSKLGLDEKVFESSRNWLAMGADAFRIGILVDPLTVVMLFMVPLAVMCIFIYSIGYMAHDPRQARFFALISLFAGAMLTLVVADNLLLLFVGWEVMGVCSYLLIGFWYEKKSAYRAAIKAFTTTRVADVIMLLGIVYLHSMTGTLSFRDILYNEEVLTMLAGTPALIVGSWGISAAGLIGVFLIIGTIGKSAQFPLHVWLPDAMEGPTPVSAMIHAAAMVSAGIYAIIRMYPLFEAGGYPHSGEFTLPLLLMAVVGAFTALFAATIALTQNDVKKVLAYSTISQLGFMMAALGIGAYIAAFFHLITHAFFKALLFMASGSVIHAMEHGEHHLHEHHDEEHSDHAHDHAHDDHEAHDSHDAHDHHETVGEPIDRDAVDEPVEPHFDPQDMRNMGGLIRNIPVTAWTFIIGGISLAGFPLLTAGFWSKDEILADAWYVWSETSSVVHIFVFVMLVMAAFLTAFYTARQLSMTFLGAHRTEEASHAGLGGSRSIISITMQLPLVILAFFAIVAGFVGVPPDFPIFGSIFAPDGNPFFNFVKYSLLTEMQPPKPPFNAIPVLASFAVALGGLYLGWRMYGRTPLKAGEPDPMTKILSPSVYKLLQNKYYIDELYVAIFVKPSKWFAKNVVVVFVDKGIIDGTLHLIARVFTWIGDLFKVLNLWLIDGVGDGIPQGIIKFGAWFRRIQTGQVQQYLLLVLVAVLLVGLIFAVSAGFLQAAG
ncbi:MAG: NADH-quinone oxidoreductase subunit L [bacterium]|nr:NADH-quinone oxidoreductase subunit L [bacterium]